MRLFVYIFIFVITIVTTEALVCYNCSTLSDSNCYPGKKVQAAHLIQCPIEAVCGTLIKDHPYELGQIVRLRSCVNAKSCKYGYSFPICCKCYTDACNNNEQECWIRSEAVSLSSYKFFFILPPFLLTIVAH